MSSIGQSQELLQLRAELFAAQEVVGAAHTRTLEAEAELACIKAVNADLLARNAHLELMNAMMRRDKYGASWIPAKTCSVCALMVIH